MLRKHRAKDLVDAAYNRFSWNDDADLPDWFVDDEKKHYRPQVPLPPALVEQMKRKFMNLASKPIQKVAEARARKRRRATQRLAVAKKKATAMASNPGERLIVPALIADGSALHVAADCGSSDSCLFNVDKCMHACVLSLGVLTTVRHHGTSTRHGFVQLS